MSVGVLAFQGDFAEHLLILRSLGVPCSEVRTIAELSRVDRLIIPGGESTVIGRFLRLTGVGEGIRRRVHRGSLAVYGTCAGAILLAKRVVGRRTSPSLALMDIAVERNAYGTQLQSFAARLRVQGIARSLSVVFIRAPEILSVGAPAQVLASHGGVPVLVRQGRLLASTFHSEVRGEVALHEIFLRL